MHFCVLKNIAKKSIHHTLLENLFFVIETVLHLSVTTFFECEMKISYKECISESENMEWMIKQLSKIREIETCSLYSAYLEAAI